MPSKPGNLPVVSRKLATLKLLEDNERNHTDQNLATIRSSLEQYGQVEPLVVRKKTSEVIGGNGRLSVMRELEWTHCDCVVLDISALEARKLGLLLNRSGELAEWDYQALANTLAMLKSDDVDMESLGWKDYELEPLLKSEFSPDDLDTSSGGLPSTKSVGFSPDQWMTIERAIEKIRVETGDEQTAAARAIELVCADYVA